MTRHLLLSALMAAATSLFAQQQPMLDLTVNIKGYEGKQFNLQFGGKTQDSAVVRRGVCHIVTPMPEVTYVTLQQAFNPATIKPTDRIFGCQFWAGADTISINCDTETGQAEIVGSPTEDEYQAYKEYMKPIRDKQLALRYREQEAFQRMGESVTAAYLDSIRMLQKEERTHFWGFLAEHPSSYISLNTIYNYRVLEKLPYSEYSNMVRYLTPGAFHGYQWNVINEFLRKDATLEPGQPMPELSAQDYYGKMVSTADYKGHLLLVTLSYGTGFGEYDTDLPMRRELYEKYHDQGFDMLDVLVSTDKSAILKTVAQNKIPWSVTYNQKSWNDPWFGEHAIDHLGQTFLVNPRGKIISNQLFGDAVREAIESYYNNALEGELPHDIRPDEELLDVRTSQFPNIPTLSFTNIPGAVRLQQPLRIDGTVREIRTEEHGLIYPIAYDWNHDGLPDLLCGEFVTGQSRVKVYLNEGTKKQPKFTGDWFYALCANGDTLQNHEWCCIGIHPQVVDVDGDGYDDLISGQYNPGLISWWRGSKDGFQPQQFIPQQGWDDSENSRTVLSDKEIWQPGSNTYWNYTTARLADFDGDGLPDLFVGGSAGYRVALNIGTREHPKFGLRQFLYHLDGTILHSSRLEGYEESAGEDFFTAEDVCGDSKAMLNPIDWDGDGVLDILLTPSYTHRGNKAVYFFRGVKTDDGIRFEHAVPLFEGKLPGVCPQISFCDWNGDGVRDMLLGLAICTTGELEGTPELYDKWEGSDLHIEFPGKDCGENTRWYKGGYQELEEMAQEKGYRDYLLGRLSDRKYLSLRHRGYPFVLLGKKAKQKAKAVTAAAQPKIWTPNYDKNRTTADHPVTYEHDVKKIITARYGSILVQTTFHVMEGFHLYPDVEANKDFIATKIEFIDMPDYVSLQSSPFDNHQTTPKGSNLIYTGQEINFVNMLKADPAKIKVGDRFNITIRVTYQTCNDQMCLPPVTEDKTYTIIVTE